MSEVRYISVPGVSVDRKALHVLLRFREGTTALDGRVERLVDETMREGRSLVEPAAVLRDVAIEAEGEKRVVIDGGRLLLDGVSIARHLEGAERGTLLAVTIGGGVPARVRELSEEGEITRASILDAFGSEAVEAMADAVTAQVASEARRADCTLTARFSPGYGDLSLDHQKALLDYVEAERIGISLSESMTMVPEKSITAAIGWKGRKR